MTATVIAFTGRNTANTNARPRTLRESATTYDNIVSMAGWIGRSRPRRTPTGVFFTSQVLVAPGQFA